MEQGTLVGTILAWVLLFVAMCFDFNTFQVNAGNLGYFVDAPSLMIVFGGTIASTFISHTMGDAKGFLGIICLLYTSPSPRDKRQSRMPSSA